MGKKKSNLQNENAKIDDLKERKDAGEFLTTNQGLRISDNQNSLKAGERGPSLLEDFILREKITHFDHERIPERVVHARGSAAHGYFQVYKPMKSLTKAKFLQDPAKKTPVFVRFSTVAGFRGSADTVRDVRGFATKFYTEEGNYDLVGNNMPVFFIQDAIKFPDFIHAVKPEPHNEIPQASSAHDNFWDFISLTPESMHMIMWVLSDRAFPRSYSTMEGFGVHTFRLINEKGESHFVKFHWKPLNGIHSLIFEETQIIAGKDPDFNRRDLWDLIEQGHYPEYELGIQVLGENELNKVEFDVLDPTKIWPEEDVPVKRIGKMVLNRNPDNFFAETEQVAFHPGHLVPGIDFTNDPLLQGRIFSYLDTQLSRLGGPNFHQIPINRPLADISNNQRDGIGQQTVHKGKVNYEPNSLAGGCPMQALWSKGGFASFSEKMSGEKVRVRPESFGDHYSQASLFWNSMSDPERRHIIKAFQFELGNVSHRHIQEKMLEHLNQVSYLLAVEVAKGLGLEPPKPNKGKEYKKKSPALSMENQKPDTVKGRKIAVLLSEKTSPASVKKIKKSLEDQGIIIHLIAPCLGKVGDLSIDKAFLTATSVAYDGVVVLGDLLNSGDALKFIHESYRHCKPIGAFGDGIKLLKETFIAAVKFVDPNSNQAQIELGVVTAGSKADLNDFCTNFRKALVQHRHWGRELKDRDKIPG